MVFTHRKIVASLQWKLPTKYESISIRWTSKFIFNRNETTSKEQSFRRRNYHIRKNDRFKRWVDFLVDENEFPSGALPRISNQRLVPIIVSRWRNYQSQESHSRDRMYRWKTDTSHFAQLCIRMFVHLRVCHYRDEWKKKDEQWTKERRTKRDVAGREKNRSRRFAPTARWIVVIRLRLDLHREETTKRSFRGRRDLTYSARKNRALVRAARKTATARPIPENHWL